MPDTGISLLSTIGQQGAHRHHDRAAPKDLPPRPPRGTGARMAPPPPPAMGDARPPDGARRGRRGGDRRRVRALEPGSDLALGRQRIARDPLARRLARRDAGPGPPFGAAAVRLLPRPPG